MAMETRTKNDVKEHRHREFDYWHPAARVHTPHYAHVHGFDPAQVIWAADQSGTADIVDAMHFKQMHFVNLFGEVRGIDTYARWRGTEPGTPAWCKDVSIGHVSVSLTYRAGKISAIALQDYRSAVKIMQGQAHYERNTPLHDAKLLIESGLAEAYIDNPHLVDAMHLLHVAGDDRYYDLITLPSGGHVPIDILEEEYDVQWETLAMILLGKPRDNETFSCPICGQASYYTGICDECCEDSEYDDELCQRIKHVNATKVSRKELEHGEILRLIKSGNWKACRYMRG